MKYSVVQFFYLTVCLYNHTESPVMMMSKDDFIFKICLNNFSKIKNNADSFNLHSDCVFGW